MKTKQLKAYFKLKEKIKELTAKLKQLEVDVYDDVSENDGILETKFATFKIVCRPKWRYSDELVAKIKETSERIKLAKKQEELTGKAEKISDGGSIRMTPRKDK